MRLCLAPIACWLTLVLVSYAVLRDNGEHWNPKKAAVPCLADLSRKGKVGCAITRYQTKEDNMYEACDPREVDPEVYAICKEDMIAELATRLKGAEAAHAEYERNIGRKDDDWPTFYARHLLALDAHYAEAHNIDPMFYSTQLMTALSAV